MFQRKSFRHNEVELVYFVGPENGPPLVLLHGTSGRWSAFKLIIPFFEPYFTIYAMNLRGHGESSHTKKYGSEDFASDIIAFLNESFESPVSLIGHSLGALVAMTVAAELRHLSHSIVLLDPPIEAKVLDNPKFSFREYFAACRDAAAKTNDPKEMLKLLGANDAWACLSAREWSELDPAVMSQTIDESLWNTFLLDELMQRITCPVFLLYGNPDMGGVMSEEQAQCVEGGLSNCVKQYIESGHGFIRDKPVETAMHILHFLDFVDGW